VGGKLSGHGLGSELQPESWYWKGWKPALVRDITSGRFAVVNASAMVSQARMNNNAHGFHCRKRAQKAQKVWPTVAILPREIRPADDYKP